MKDNVVLFFLLFFKLTLSMENAPVYGDQEFILDLKKEFISEMIAAVKKNPEALTQLLNERSKIYNFSKLFDDSLRFKDIKNNLFVEARLQIAAMDGSEALINLIAKLKITNIDFVCASGFTPLVTAVKQNNFVAVESFLKVGADPNQKMSSKLASLPIIFSIIRDDQKQLFNLFVRFGVDLSCSDSSGVSAYEHLEIKKRIFMLEYLAKHDFKNLEF